MMIVIDGTRLSRTELWPDKLPNSFLNRVKQTIDFIDLKGKVMDCGENNPMKEMIQTHFNYKIESVDWDFNEVCNHKGKYDTILCFEVLEHVMNPLLFLNQLKWMLTNDGVIYLSTPYQRPQILKAIHHYHEIPDSRIGWLFDAAGLRVVCKGKVTIAGNWYNHITGIRPLLRYFQNSRIYQLQTS
jgi:hypothetical protein